MTIDEAIQRENNIAEENQKIVDTEIVFDDVSLSQLYCDDTEVIEEHLENYKKCVEYHKQIVEWLEELKCYKNDNDFSDYADRLHKIAFNSGYNKAIDYFADKIIRYVDCGHLCSPTEVRWSDLSVVEMIKELAEQLKERD